MKVINENIINTNATFIAHQCNCVGEVAGGVAAAIFKKWPACDDYRRKTHGKFGTIRMHQVEPNKFVINMFSQYWPGGQSDDPKDTDLQRRGAFDRCLSDIVGEIRSVLKEQPNQVPFITFPFLIGCGIAGGDWGKYHHMLSEFESQLELGVPDSKVQLSRYNP